MTFPASARHFVESQLYRFGFVSEAVRHLLCIQILLSAATFVIGVAAFFFTRWPLFFAAGTILSSFSLWQISRFALSCQHQQFSAALGVRLFLGFTGRLLLIGIVLFVLLVWCKAPVIPLVAGLTSTVAVIVLWGASRHFRKTTVKEA